MTTAADPIESEITKVAEQFARDPLARIDLRIALMNLIAQDRRERAIDSLRQIERVLPGEREEATSGK